MNVDNTTSARRSAYAATDPGTSTSGNTTGTTTSTTGTKTLGFDDFLKLLTVQFQQQDPMQPMEDTAFIAQMAQFSALQQNTTLVSEMSQFGADQQQGIAASYLGRTVTVQLPDGTSATGEVSAVQTVDGAPQLVVGDQNWPLSSVVRVEPTTPPPATTPPTTTQPATNTP